MSRHAAAALLCAALIAIPTVEARPRDPFSGFVASVSKAFSAPKAKARKYVAKRAVTKRTVITRKAKPYKVARAVTKSHPTKVGPARYVAKQPAKRRFETVYPSSIPEITVHPEPKADPDLDRYALPGSKQIGIASWYGPGFHGKLTACGAIKGFTSAYNEWRMTAAHRTLKCGTEIEVHANGKTVYLTITDRGPFIAGRVLDVSRGAAQELGMMKSGTAKVTFYVLGKD